uniref:Actin n=1 Tax=Leptobrachium leishanense TaxID=445787 RepID=A0A8C5MZS5_9ANUR
MFDSNVLDSPAVIFDNGSGLCKAGLSDQNYPRSVLSTLIGRPRKLHTMHLGAQKDFFIGNESHALRGILTLTCPMQHGVITNWEDMEKIWTHMYNCELGVCPSERPVLLTEAPLNPLQNREKMAEVMFEEFKVPAMYVALQAPLTLYAYGLLSGIVVDSGDGVTHTACIYNGYNIQYAVSRIDIAGSDITKYLMNILSESGFSFMTSAEREIVKSIKEQLCYVALDPEKEMNKNTIETMNEYKLPDGNTIMIGNQLFRAPEILFTPYLIGMESPGIHQMLYSSILKCDIDVRRDLLNSILLSGGSTLFPGLYERLLQEMKRHAAVGVPVKILALPDRVCCAWVGASMLASLPSFKETWVTVCDYEECGPSIVHKKCF